MKINLKASLETRNFKNGPLEVLVLNLSENTQKLVFLTSAETEILKINHKGDYSYDDDELDLR